MKKNLGYFFLLTLGLVLFSCGNADDDVDFNIGDNELGIGKEPDKCLGFDENEVLLSIQDEFTTLPGKVSILFKVSDLLGNPISGINADQFTIYEQGRNDACFNLISGSESQARISPNTQVFHNNTLLVLDLSNSVLSSSLEELKVASSSFINNVMPTDQTESFKMAIYWFDGENELHLLNDLTSSAEELTTAIQGIGPDISSDVSTDLYGAVIKSTKKAEELLKANTQAIGAASIVLFTDGTDQASRYRESDAIKAVKEADRNISYYTIGLGAEIDTGVLTEIGKTASVFAANKAELENTFNQISQRVAQQANSFYLFEYCTPKRDGSGESNLVIQLTTGSLQGAVQTKFNAKGFVGGCE